MTLKIIGRFQEIDGEDFSTIAELIQAKGLIGSTSADVGNIELYYDNYGNTYAVVHDSEKYYGKKEVGVGFNSSDVIRRSGRYPWGETSDAPGLIKEVPPGTLSVLCAHYEDLKVSSTVVCLDEIPGEVGYHGTCQQCGSRYFSRPNGPF